MLKLGWDSRRDPGSICASWARSILVLLLMDVDTGLEELSLLTPAALRDLRIVSQQHRGDIICYSKMNFNCRLWSAFLG